MIMNSLFLSRNVTLAATCKDYLQVQSDERVIGAESSSPVFNERQVLPNAGRVCKKAAEEHARQEYERFAGRRREYKEVAGEGESIKALEEAVRLVGRKQEKVEGGE
jgi:hypothetical protein